MGDPLIHKAQSLARLEISDGRELPLLAVADLEYAPGIKRIQRWNGNRVARVSADLKENVREDIMQDLEANFFPDWEKRYPGIIRGAVGQAEGEKRFIEDVKGLYLIAFFAMYTMLAVAFRSYWRPILILIAMPYAFVGAIVGHSVLGLTMAIFSYFGIAAAAGWTAPGIVDSPPLSAALLSLLLWLLNLRVFIRSILF